MAHLVILVKRREIMLKFEGKFCKGDYIRAFDFKPMRGQLDIYVEGPIIDIHDADPDLPGGDYSYFEIMVDIRAIEGKLIAGKLGERAKVPMGCLKDYDYRIVKL